MALERFQAHQKIVRESRDWSRSWVAQCTDLAIRFDHRCTKRVCRVNSFAQRSKSINLVDGQRFVVERQSERQL